MSEDTPSAIGFRCGGSRPNGKQCNRLLAIILTPPYLIDCPRCGYRNIGSAVHPLSVSAQLQTD